MRFVQVSGLVRKIAISNIAHLNPPPRITYCPLDGRPVAGESALERRPLLVKVENLDDARPQSGLDKADVIIEAMAEGGITRFAVVYLCRDAEEIGPVRSARLQDLDLLSEYDAVFAHVGSSDTYADNAEDVADLDEFANGDAYWRSEERDAPHNTYTSTKLLRDAAAGQGYDRPASSEPLTFGITKPGAPAVSIDIPYGARCDARYEYDAATKTYPRSVHGEPHVNKPTGARLAPSTVIVQFVDYTDSWRGEEYGMGGRQVMAMEGTGRALIFTGGTVVDGGWHRESTAARTTFTDNGGNPVTLARGQIWIEIVPSGWDIPFASGQAP